ncbi:MAG: ABC transporter substrate-binding protein [Myxococcota bacterium]
MKAPAIDRRHSHPFAASAVWAAAMLALAAISGCGDEVDRPPSSTSLDQPAASAKVFYGQRSAAHKNLDPIKQFDSQSSEIIANVYDTLLSYHYLNRPYELVPLLLEKMPEKQPDGVTYSFTLKKGVHFSDDECFEGGKGRELTVDDVFYNIKRFADANENVKSYPLLAGFVLGLDEFREKTRELGKGVDYAAHDVAGLIRIDDYNFQIRFTGDNPLALYPFAAQIMSIVPKEAVDYYGEDFANHPVGTGPFTIKEYSRRGTIVLAKNPNYHDRYPDSGAPGDEELGLLADAGKQLPFVDEVRLPLIEEAQPAMLQFRKGQIDWLGIDKDNFTKMAFRDDEGEFHLKPPFDEQFGMYVEPGLSAEFLVFNMDDPLVGKNKPLRQAIALALDVDEFIRVLMNDRGLPLATLVPHPIAGSEKDIGFERRGVDLEAAKEKLAEAGYPGGEGLPELTIEYRASTKDARQGFEFIRNELAAIGIRVKPNFQTFSAFLKRIESGNFQIIIAGWAADFPDAENFYQLLYSENRIPLPNHGNFADPEYDEHYLASRFMPNGPQRYEHFRRMSEIVREEVPLVLRFNGLRFGLYQQWIGNMKRNIMLDKPYKYFRVNDGRRDPST